MIHKIKQKTTQKTKLANGQFLDTDEQKKVVEELAKYHQRLDQAQKIGQTGIFEWDIKANQTWWSEGEEELLGVKPGKSNGTFANSVVNIYSEDSEKVQKNIQDSIKNGGKFEIEFRLAHPKKGIRWITGKGQIFFDKNGKPEKMIGVNFDVTERKQIELALTFKSEANKALADSLDYQTTLNTVANLAISYMADWCVVNMVNADGQVELLSVAHQNPDKVKWAWELSRQNPVDMLADYGLAYVLKTGKSVFVPELTSETIAQIPDKRERELIKKIGFSSAIIVPLRLLEKVVGAITFVYTESKRRYTSNDLQIAEQLADKASLAIENSKLYQEVANEKARLDTLVSSVPGVVWEAWGQPDTSSQKINFVSSHVEQMLGYTVDEWLSTPNFWLNIVHSDDKEKAAAESAAFFASGQGGVSRFRWMTKTGQAIWVEAQSYIIKDETGQSVGMRGVTMDISERIKAEQRKDEFISIASHELKTPVTVIKGYAQILQQLFSENPKAVHYLAKMNAEVNRLTTLVNDLLDVSRVQSGKLVLQLEAFSIYELIEDIIEDLQQTSKQHKIWLYKTKPFTTDQQIVADRYRISQVVINLVLNAIKYSPKADSVIVSVSSDKNDVTISIRDFGIGIAKKDLDKIFERFYQAKNNIRPSFSGLGLGLHISSEIIKRHQGSIWVESQKGKGSVFSFKLSKSPQKRIIVKKMIQMVEEESASIPVLPLQVTSYRPEV